MFNHFSLQGKEICQEALDTWGPEAQTDKLVEECAELIEAVIKYRNGRVDAEHVAQELADVMIMCEQVSILLPQKEGKDLVSEAVERKLSRLKDRLNKKKGIQQCQQPSSLTT